MDLLQYFIKACNCDVEQNKKKTKCLHDIEAYSDRYLTCVVVPYHLFTLALSLAESMRTF